MAQQRERRKARSAPKEAKPPQEWMEKEKKTKNQKKIAMLRGLTGKLLHERGIEEGATEKQVKEARRDAKAILKEEKVEWRELSKGRKLERKRKQEVSERAKKRNGKSEGGEAVEGGVEVAA